MLVPSRGARPLARAIIPACALVGAAVLSGASGASAAPAPSSARAVTGGRIALGDSLFGRSGKLRARFISGARRLGAPILAQLFGDSAATRPGIYAVPDSAAERPFTFITLSPFSLKARGRVDDYRIGFWPAERRAPRSAAYENPDGFVRVTADAADTPVSEHFRLRDFLTHDQQDTWPKYLVLREDLVDKLELVIADLDQHGHRVSHMTVMSGFRTPQYNQRGVGAGGRAQDSRHQFGDAADVFVDNDGDGRMDDLNGDGRVNAADAQVIIDAAERVELAHPDLVGGAGRYHGTRAHGPFAHIDARGTRARWSNA